MTNIDTLREIGNTDDLMFCQNYIAEADMELDAARARIAKLESALMVADADAEILFGWANMCKHDFSCATNRDDTAVCTCCLLDDLNAHIKRIAT